MTVAEPDPELGSSRSGQDDQLVENAPHIRHFADVVSVVMLAKNWLVNAKEHLPDHSEEHRRNHAQVFELQPRENIETTVEEPLQNQNSANSNTQEIPDPVNPSSSASIAETVVVRPLSERLKDKSLELWKSAPTETVDPAKSVYYYWTFVVYIAFLYNSLMCVMFVFDDTQGAFFDWWFSLNMVCDFIYLLDIFINSKLNQIEDGMKIKGWRILARRYFKSRRFAFDVLSLLPSDIALLVSRRYSIIRVNRLIKLHRVFDFVERTNIRTNYPNGFRIFHIVVTCAVIFHLNAALYFKISLITGINSTKFGAWEFNYVKTQDFYYTNNCTKMSDADAQCGVQETEDEIDYRQDAMADYITYWKYRVDKLLFSNFAKQYSLSIYWSSLTLTTSGQQPFPTAASHNLLEIVDTISGVLVFAVIVGSVGNVVVTMNKGRAEYQNLMDGIKFYMNYRQVGHDIQGRVMDCVSYIQKNSSFQDESVSDETIGNKLRIKDIMEAIPRRLQGELAVHLHMNNLKRVELLKECEPNLLYEFVMKLTMHMYGPNDYLCRVGDVAKEMYIVKQGTLETLSATGMPMNTLGEGATFGELSLLKISSRNKANRRHRSLRSIGYSDVYHLKQEDVIEILRDYPDARDKLIKKARIMMQKQRGGLPKMDPSDELTQKLEGVRTVEESLAVLDHYLQTIDQNLEWLYSDFQNTASVNKKRVTRLEGLYKRHHDMDRGS